MRSASSPGWSVPDSPGNPVVEIAADDELYRRLAPLHVNPDGTVNSAAFKLRGFPDPELSVDLARLTTPEASLARAPKPGFALGRLHAGDARSLGLTVRYDPLHDNRAHTLILGQRREDKTTSRKLAQMTTVVLRAQTP